MKIFRLLLVDFCSPGEEVSLVQFFQNSSLCYAQAALHIYLSPCPDYYISHSFPSLHVPCNTIVACKFLISSNPTKRANLPCFTPVYHWGGPAYHTRKTVLYVCILYRLLPDILTVYVLKHPITG